MLLLRTSNSPYPVSYRPYTARYRSYIVAVSIYIDSLGQTGGEQRASKGQAGGKQGASICGFPVGDTRSRPRPVLFLAKKCVGSKHLSGRPVLSFWPPYWDSRSLPKPRFVLAQTYVTSQP